METHTPTFPLQTNGNKPPKVAAIHDLSGFGHTSLSVVMPVLSVMGVEVCAMPTAILSSHTTEFTDFTFLDLTGEMHKIIAHWQKLNLSFEAIYSGFLASPEQMDSVITSIKTLLKPNGFAVIDPVLGDNGVLDPTMTPAMVTKMRHLINYATVITPNFTEASFLLNEPYPHHISTEKIIEWAKRLSDSGPRMVIITSVPTEDDSVKSVFAYDKQADCVWRVPYAFIPAFYPGTGDTFASVLTGALVLGESLPVAVDKAVQFVSAGIILTAQSSRPTREGLMIEKILATLATPLTKNTFELLEGF